jgi:hypothetical protein
MFIIVELANGKGLYTNLDFIFDSGSRYDLFKDDNGHFWLNDLLSGEIVYSVTPCMEIVGFSA